MDSLPKKILLSGDDVRWCVNLCEAELLGDVAETFDERLGRDGIVLPVSLYDLKEWKSLIRKAMNRPRQKRAAWFLSHASPDACYWVFCGALVAWTAAKPRSVYRVSVRWTSDYLTAAWSGRWPEARRGAPPENWTRLLSSTQNYLAWEDQGGNPNLARWLSLYDPSGASQSSEP